jgi:hypothetical protein
MMPERTSIRSNSGHERRNSSYLLLGAEAHHPLDAGAVVPGAVEQHDLAAGGQVRHVALEVPLGLLALGRLAGSATTRQTRGFSRWVMRLITPPLPAASRPSKITTI